MTAKVISIHSFRGGTGKSNTTANVAYWLAQEGKRVGVIDTDIQSPGIHVLFGVPGKEIVHSLNDYLWGRCDIETAVHDVTAKFGVSGRLFLIPSSIQAGEIVEVLRRGYDVSKLTAGFRQLIDELNLDVLLIDTHPGLNEETLFSIAISHALVVILRPDHQDYEGTGVTVEVARSLDVPRMFLVVNKTPTSFDREAVAQMVAEAYDSEVALVLPYSEDVMTLASSGIFSAQYPEHDFAKQYQKLAQLIKD